MSEGVTLVSILNSHMLRQHTKSAMGYIISRLLTRVIADLPPDSLPDFLYKALNVPADVLNVIKSDAFWEKHLQLLFQPSVFMAASSSLASLARTPGANVLLIIDSSSSRVGHVKGSSAKKVNYRSLFESDEEYMFAPWSTAFVFRLKCKAVRSANAAFRCYPPGSSLPNISVASGAAQVHSAAAGRVLALRAIYYVMWFAAGIAVFLLVEMIPYNESKHSSVHALEIL